jgi:hypothetical protein
VQRVQQAVLVVKAAVESTDGRSGRLRDIDDCHAVEPILRQQPFGGVQEPAQRFARTRLLRWSDPLEHRVQCLGCD